MTCAIDAERKGTRFVLWGGPTYLPLPPGIESGQRAHERFNSAIAFSGRAEVARVDVRPPGLRMCGDRDVSRKRLQHVLPWPDRARLTQLDRVPASPRAKTVRNDPVLVPVAAAEHVTGPRRGYEH